MTDDRHIVQTAPDTISAFRRAAFITLALSVPALVVVSASVTWGSHFTSRSIVRWYPQILVAFFCMSVFVWMSAPLVAETCARHFLIMGCYFVVVFLLGAATGSITSMFIYHEVSLRAYVAKPLYWLLLFGVAPAFVLGTIGAAILKRLLRGR